MINDKLKAVRDSLGLSQMEFATRIGIKQSYYSALELGKKEVTSKLLKTLFENVGVSSQWWYNSIGTIFSDKVWGNHVGVDVGHMNYEHIIKRRLLIELLKGNSEEGNIYKAISEVSNFQFVIDNIRHYYFTKIDLAEDNIAEYVTVKSFNYEAYKENVFKCIREFEEMKPVLDRLAKAINQFYIDFQPFDKKGIIKGYFGG